MQVKEIWYATFENHSIGHMYKRFDWIMLGQRYTGSNYDHCVYDRKLTDDYFIYLLLYVDDMLITSKSKVEIDMLKDQLSKEFEIERSW